MATAGEQINRALRLLGILAEGETPTAAMSQDALVALNQMIDSWNTERLSVFSTQDQVFSWPAGVKTATLGPVATAPVIGTTLLAANNGQLITTNSGLFIATVISQAAQTHFLGSRPILIDDATYFRDPANNVSFGIKLINQQQYDGIAVKTVTSTYPQVMWVNMTYPNIELTIYPVPTRQLEWHFISVEELTQPATLATELQFPPGYLRAFTYNLACEFAPEFGVEPSPQVQRNLKRINNPDDIMSLPYSLVATRQRFNVYAGNY